MILFSNLIGKCEGGNCPLKDSCVRYIEYINSDPCGIFNEVLVVPNSKHCKNYIKVAQ